MNMNLRQERMRLLALAPETCLDAAPVSYTHLDVYKRQIMDLVLEKQLLTRKELDELLLPENMIHPFLK